MADPATGENVPLINLNNNNNNTTNNNNNARPRQVKYTETEHSLELIFNCYFLLERTH